MKTLVLYDKNGSIATQMSGDYKTPVGNLEVEIPEGKRIVSIDVATKKPIFEDLPIGEKEQMRKELESIKKAVDYIILGGF